MLQVARLSPKLLGEAADLVADIPHTPIAAYLRPLGDGESLDFIHLGCLARCWANLPAILRDESPRLGIAARIERHRSRDGGYSPALSIHPEVKESHGTLYGCFLAAASYQDLKVDMRRPLAMLDCIQRLRAADWGYANQEDVPVGLTPATALHALAGMQVDISAIQEPCLDYIDTLCTNLLHRRCFNLTQPPL